MRYALASTADGFHAAPHQGDVYRSTDGGRIWEELRVVWFRDQPGRRPYVNALVAVD